MIVIIMLPLTLLIIAGFGYTVYTDLKEHKNGPIIEIDAETIQERQAAETEIEYCDKQLAILRQIASDAETAHRNALQAVNQDRELNKYGAVVPEKIVTKHINKRDAAANKLIAARTKVHNLELKRLKASAKIG